MTTPAVSVVMSAYSRQFIRQAIESILGQTYADFEFIIVDDSNNEEMRALLCGYAAQDARIVLHHNPQNMGQTLSLSTGFALARGYYIARQDDDDVSAPARLEHEVALLTADPAIGMVGTQVHLIDTDGRVIGGSTAYPIHNADMQALLLRNSFVCHGSVMLRREPLKLLGGYDEKLRPADDYDLWLRLSEITQLALVEEPLYSFRMHAQSQSQRYRHVQIRNAAAAQERALLRRHGNLSAGANSGTVAERYLEAAIVAQAAKAATAARQNLRSALVVSPSILDQSEPLSQILLGLMYHVSVEESLALCETVFSTLLPRRPNLARFKSKLVAQLHMREAFASFSSGKPVDIQRHLWSGITSNPRWLMNRGVISMLLRSLLQPSGNTPASIG